MNNTNIQLISKVKVCDYFTGELIPFSIVLNDIQFPVKNGEILISNLNKYSNEDCMLYDFVKLSMTDNVKCYARKGIIPKLILYLMRFQESKLKFNHSSIQRLKITIDGFPLSSIGCGSL